MNRLTNQAIAGDEIDALVAEVCPPALVVSDTAVRQLRPLLEELLRLRKQETPQEAWKRGFEEGVGESIAEADKSGSLRPQTKLAMFLLEPTFYIAPPLPYQEEKETGR